jgi:hypothetical protein
LILYEGVERVQDDRSEGVAVGRCVFPLTDPWSVPTVPMSVSRGYGARRPVNRLRSELGEEREEKALSLA